MDMKELEDIENRVARLERMLYLLIGLQVPQLVEYLPLLV